MKRTNKLYFDRKVAQIFTGIFLMICTINQVNAEVSQLSPISQDDFENVLNRNSTQFYESENPKNLLDDFFGKNNEPNETEFQTNFQDLSIQVDSKNLREIYKQKLLEMSGNNEFTKDKNNWNFFNSKI